MHSQKRIDILEKIIEYGFYGLIFFIPISTAFVESFAALIILCFLIKIAYSRDFSVFKNNARVFWFLLAFFVFLGLSLVNSGPFFFKSLRALFSKWGEYLLIFVVAVDHFQSRERIKRFFDVFVVSATLVGLSALSQKLFGFEFLRQRAMSGFAVTGPFINPNSLSAYLVVCLPVIMALGCFKSNKKSLKIIIFSICCVLFVALLLTFSRGGWLGFILALMVMIFLSKDKRVMIILSGMFALSLAFVPLLRQRFLYSFLPGGDSQRFKIWQGAWEMIKVHPFRGKGLGLFSHNFELYAPGFGEYYAHNAYLHMWAESGILALSSFLLLNSIILWKGVWISFKSRSNNFNVLLCGLIGSFSGFLTHSFFDTHFYFKQFFVLFWLMLGVTYSLENVLLKNINKTS